MLKLPHLKKNKVTFVFAFLLLIVVCPLFIPGLSPGMDWVYHIVRVESLKEGLINHEFPVKIHSLPLNGYGYGSGLFYPQVFLYLPAILRVLGFSIDLANKVFIFLLFFAKILVSYHVGRYITKNKFVSVCVTMMLVLSPLALFKSYMLLSYGDMVGEIFSPLVICGVYNLVYEDFDKPYLIGLGFLGLIFSHVISSMMMAIAVLFIVLFNLKKVILDKKKISKLLLVIVIDALISAFIWCPIIEQMITGKFFVSQPWPDFVKRSKLFEMCVLYLSPYLPKWLIITMLVVTTGLIAFFIFKFVDMVKSKAADCIQKKFVLDLTFSNVILLIMMTDIFPSFLIEKIFGFLQFTSRFFYIVDIFLAFSVPIGLCLCLGKNINKVKVFLGFFFALFFVDVIMFACTFKFPKVITDEVIRHETTLSEDTIYFEDGRVFSYDVGWGKEYVPLDTDITLLNQKDVVVTDKGKEIFSDRTGNSLSFSVDNIKSEYFDIPRLYYKGYEAIAEDQSGQKYKLEVVKGNNGLARVISNGSEYKKIEIAYVGTCLLKISQIISICATVLILCFFVFYRRVKNNF